MKRKYTDDEAARPSGGEITEKGTSEQAPTYQRLLDESLTETFPASDPISPSAAMRTNGEVESPRDERDWKLKSSNDAGESPIDRGPIPFPTQAHHPGTREERVREAAHRRFMERGGEHGHDLEDWTEAEREIDEIDRQDEQGKDRDAGATQNQDVRTR